MRTKEYDVNMFWMIFLSYCLMYCIVSVWNIGGSWRGSWFWVDKFIVLGVGVHISYSNIVALSRDAEIIELFH